jgi:4-amino-4-deoxy-L-arabinose transferase-like glycosyltransferase
MQSPTYDEIAKSSSGSRPTLVRWTLARARLLTFALMLTILGFSFQGARGISDPDEGRYVSIAENMLATGEFMIPRLGPGEAHFAKPPLTYWAIATSLAVVGHTEFAARLPSALAFTMTGFLVLMLGKTIRLKRPALAALIWAVSLLPFVAGSVVTTDMLLTFFETLAVLGYLRWRLEGSERGIWLMWLSFGAAFLTKGPPALLPLLAILAYPLFWRQGARTRALFQLSPVLCFLAIAFFWIAFVIARDPSLWHYFLVNETFDRIASGVHDRNPGWTGLLKVYLPTIAIGTLPFGPLLAWSLARRSKRSGDTQTGTRSSTHRGFLHLWMALPFAVFAMSQSRLPLYLLPLTVPFALVAASRFEEVGVSTGLIRNLGLLFAVALLTLRLSSVHWANSDDDARVLFRTLQSQIDVANFDEILFVDVRRASYGLQFYSRKTIAATYARTAPHAGEHTQPLCSTLKRSGDPLLLVPAGQASLYTSLASRCAAKTFVAMGRTRGFDLIANPRRVASTSSQRHPQAHR